MSCNIDATVSGRNNPGFSNAIRVVIYSGEDIICDSGLVNENGKVTLSNCVVGESNTVYNVTNGIVN